MASSKDALIFALIITAGASLVTFVYGTTKGRWYSCRSETHPSQFDVTFSLWEVCESQRNGDMKCKHIQDDESFNDVLLDFKLIRSVSIAASTICGMLFFLAIFNFTMRKRKGVFKYTIITQIITAGFTVVAAISALLYASVRAQDIVGIGVKYVFGWGCVLTWVGTIISFLNAILTLVLMCMYFDELREINTRIAENMNFDNLSITSAQLARMADGDFGGLNNIGASPSIQNVTNNYLVTFNDGDSSFGQNDLRV